MLRSTDLADPVAPGHNEHPDRRLTSWCFMNIRRIWNTFFGADDRRMLASGPNVGQPMLTDEELRHHMLTIGTYGRGKSEPAFRNAMFVADRIQPKPQVWVWDAVGESISELSNISGIELTRAQMQGLLDRSELIEKIIDFGEVETQIRGYLANALSTELIDADWPEYRDNVDMEAFAKRLDQAAREAGYRVS
jgi:hypothetical protein